MKNIFKSRFDAERQQKRREQQTNRMERSRKWVQALKWGLPVLKPGVLSSVGGCLRSSTQLHPVGLLFFL